MNDERSRDRTGLRRTRLLTAVAAGWPWTMEMRSSPTDVMASSTGGRPGRSTEASSGGWKDRPSPPTARARRGWAATASGRPRPSAWWTLNARHRGRETAGRAHSGPDSDALVGPPSSQRPQSPDPIQALTVSGQGLSRDGRGLSHNLDRVDEEPDGYEAVSWDPTVICSHTKAERARSARTRLTRAPKAAVGDPRAHAGHWGTPARLRPDLS